MITYTLTSIGLGIVDEKRKNYGKLVSVGLCLLFLSLVLIGPAPYILPDKLWIIYMGLLLAGVGGELVYVNCVPALTKIIHIEYNDLDKELMKNYISAINTGAFGLGCILGPILASVLEAALDFRWAFTIISIIVLCVAIL
jgi:MFS family permease